MWVEILCANSMRITYFVLYMSPALTNKSRNRI